MDQQHEMRFDCKATDGADQWVCPTCGRILLIQWPPNYRRTVITQGDEYAIHNISKGVMMTAQVGDGREEIYNRLFGIS